MTHPNDALNRGLDRLNRLSRRMMPGALGGRTELASPPVAVAGMVPAVLTGQEAAAVGGVAPLAAFFNNANGNLTSGYQDFDQAYSAGDPSWFNFPKGGTDTTTVEVLEPGIYVAVFHGTSAGASFDAFIDADAGGHIAHSPSVVSSLTSICGSTAFDPSQFAFGNTQDFKVRINGAATTVFGQLAILYYPVPLFFSDASYGWAWQDTAGW